MDAVRVRLMSSLLNLSYGTSDLQRNREVQRHNNVVEPCHLRTYVSDHGIRRPKFRKVKTAWSPEARAVSLPEDTLLQLVLRKLFELGVTTSNSVVNRVQTPVTSDKEDFKMCVSRGTHARWS